MWKDLGRVVQGLPLFRRGKCPLFHSSPRTACFTHFLFNTTPPGAWIWDLGCGNLFKESIITFSVTKRLRNGKTFQMLNFVVSGSKDTIPILSHSPGSLLRFSLLPGKLTIVPSFTWENLKTLILQDSRKLSLTFSLEYWLGSCPLSPVRSPFLLPWNLLHYIVCPWHLGQCLACNIDNSVNILIDEWMNILNHLSWHFWLLGVSVQYLHSKVKVHCTLSQSSFSLPLCGKGSGEHYHSFPPQSPFSAALLFSLSHSLLCVGREDSGLR